MKRKIEEARKLIARKQSKAELTEEEKAFFDEHCSYQIGGIHQFFMLNPDQEQKRMIEQLRDKITMKVISIVEPVEHENN